ncbi:MAG: manganese efflux pump MntP family protein [Bacteroidetes bacterium]|nr:manganese efflux pump MntP family protein [Bacteroidota bacterium]MBU1116911.1 manganese efflux pump MntP family protein [Bacteroidota bacterium]MBU1798340.1 manganese efflux pump MntP family protein [Bacteroidota bacterium]
MDLTEIIVIAIGLAMDASAVSLVAACAGYADNARAKFRLAFHFGLFQFLMPIIGWSIGISFVSYFAIIDHWIAFALLLFVGGRMVISGLNPNLEGYKKDPTHGFTLIILSVATSIDALAIGLSLALLDVDIWHPSVIIGIITAALSLLSIYVGKKLNRTFGKRMEIVGGIILILIGAKILIEHLNQ